MLQPEHLINRCAAIARKGYSCVEYNPPVGAMIVKNGKVVSMGYHGEKGILHAEAVAISKCSEDITNASMYVSLEPCAHHGKTPPCVDAILQSGITHVYYGYQDPHVRASGGAQILSEAGVKTYNVQTRISESLLLPWREHILNQKKTIELYSVMSLNGTEISLSLKEDPRFKSYFIYAETILRKRTQIFFQHMIPTFKAYHISAHSSLVRSSDGALISESILDTAKLILHIIRVPFFLKTSDIGCEPFALPRSLSMHLKRIHLSTYARGTVETYESIPQNINSY